MQPHQALIRAGEHDQDPAEWQDDGPQLKDPLHNRRSGRRISKFQRPAHSADRLKCSAAVNKYSSTSGFAADAAPSDAGYAAVVYAQGQVGLPYLWGGDGPQLTELPGGQVRVTGGFDCSGLTRAAYAAAGIELPRTAQQQYDAGPLVPAGSSPQPGDLVFFGTGPDDVTHVGIAISATHMIDAPHKGAVVRVEPIWTNLVGMTRPVAGGSP